MTNRDGERTAIFGKSRSGKTSLAHEKLKGAARVFAFDPKGTWAKYPEFERLEHFSQVKPFLEDMADGAFKAVYIPEALKATERLSTLSLMILDIQRDYFWDKGGSKFTLVADELQDGFPLALPGGCPGFAEICSKGGEFGIDVVGITQSPAAVHPRFRANLDRIAAFNFSFVNDRKAVALAMEDEAVMAELITLEKYEFIYFEHGKWERKKPLSL